MLHSQLAQVSRRGRAISSVMLLTKGGLLEVRARLFIDSSGDLDLMARAGASFLGLDEGESLQPATMMFRLGPIDFAAFDGMSAQTKATLAERGVAEGALPRAALHCSRVPGRDDGWFNVTRISIDASDPFALSDGEREGRRQALAAARFIVANVPGCTRARLISFAPQLGIRETRRIEGLATLTADDLRGGAEFVDAMALGAYPIDVHHTGDADITFEELGPDHVYALPYRIAVPQGIDNALVAGRGLSATHEAHGAIRVMPTAMAVAQAVGTAAALLAASNQPASALDWRRCVRSSGPPAQSFRNSCLPGFPLPRLAHGFNDRRRQIANIGFRHRSRQGAGAVRRQQKASLEKPKMDIGDGALLWRRLKAASIVGNVRRRQMQTKQRTEAGHLRAAAPVDETQCLSRRASPLPAD